MSQRFSTSSGVSWVSLPSQTRCGCIQFFFISRFLDVPTVFAYVDWYGETEQDYGFFVSSKSSNTSLNPIILVKNIIDSLVTAEDEHQTNKIWILNHSF